MPGSEPGTQWKSTRRGRGTRTARGTLSGGFWSGALLSGLFCSMVVRTQTGSPQQGLSIQGSTMGAYATAPEAGSICSQGCALA